MECGFWEFKRRAWRDRRKWKSRKLLFLVLWLVCETRHVPPSSDISVHCSMRKLRESSQSLQILCRHALIRNDTLMYMKRFHIHGHWIFILRIFSVVFLQINYTIWENHELRMKNGNFLGWKLKCQWVGHVERKVVNVTFVVGNFMGRNHPTTMCQCQLKTFSIIARLSDDIELNSRNSLFIVRLFDSVISMWLFNIIMNSWKSLLYLKKWGNFPLPLFLWLDLYTLLVESNCCFMKRRGNEENNENIINCTATTEQTTTTTDWLLFFSILTTSTETRRREKFANFSLENSWREEKEEKFFPVFHSPPMGCEGKV